MNTPESFHEMTPRGMTARKTLSQLEEVRQTFAGMPMTMDAKLSRSAARSLAENLILKSDKQSARAYMQQNPQETISFIALANRWSNLISASPGVSIEVSADDSLPFYSLCIWFLTMLDYNEKHWLPEAAAKDDYGFGH